jgi:beta-glucosidase
VFHDCGKTVRKTSPEAIVEARKSAAESDLVILVVGENSLRSAPYDKDRTSGENHDRSDIELPGQQLELARAVAAAGKPVVVVLVNSRPIGSEWIADNIPAILEAWEPGCQGGLAVAEVLFGNVNPSGRLPITIPRSVGHIQSFYNYKPSQFFRKFVTGKTEPLYWFGHGLSYTTFKYSNLRVPGEIKPGQSVSVKVDVTNSGTRSGDEVVLVFTHDVLGTVTTPVRELKGFTRVSLIPGETKTVEMNIAYDQLALINQAMQRVVEPGDFEVFVGDLKAKFTIEP